MERAGRAVVVGGGVLGSVHALYLRRAGFEVVQLEAEPAALGASVRNFGLIWVSGRRHGPELDAAVRSRRSWEQLAAEIPGIGFRPQGSLTVAFGEEERQVMEGYAAGSEAAGRGTVFLGPGGVRELNPAVGGDISGGLWCADDAVVEPRAAVGAIQAWLARHGGYWFVTGRTVVDLAPGRVVDHLGRRWEADLVVVAAGARHGGVLGEHLAEAPLRRVRLQMLETQPFPGRLTTSLADADTLRYYPAYREADLDLLPARPALAARYRLQLLLVQRAGGELTVGDTHAYDEPFGFDLEEAASLELLGRVGRVLGRPAPPVARRWAGVYSEVTDPDLLWYRREVQPGVWAVTGAGGRGMTCAPAIAAETLAVLGVDRVPVP